VSGTFSILDWIIVGCYLLLLLAVGRIFAAHKSKSSKDYFLESNNMPYWLVAVSVIATTQSAATFLGGPDQGYGGNYVLAPLYPFWFVSPETNQIQIPQ